MTKKKQSFYKKMKKKYYLLNQSLKNGHLGIYYKYSIQVLVAHKNTTAGQAHMY